jgi:hypothetical protein
MKKLLLIISLFTVCFFLLKNKDEEIRIRVISNSDTELDIDYKNDVVKYLKNEILVDEKLTDKFFEDNYLVIEQKLNEEFNDIEVLYQYHRFENKTYNGNAIGDIYCKTLIISIGFGNGSNWWGSIFEGSLKKESTDTINYQWFLKRYIKE